VPLVVLIGASGSGKTTIARAIEGRFAASVDVFFFDRIGVPSLEQMIAGMGQVRDGSTPRQSNGWRSSLKSSKQAAKCYSKARSG
jgi:ABC-type glutathione transport system ATPase component